MKALEKRHIERMDNTEVTFLGFGALSIGRDWGYGTMEQKQRPTEEESGRILNSILDLGVNLVDTARAYHQSEERIGNYISSRRNEYVLATKCGEHSIEPSTYYDFSYDAIKESIDRSLRLLKTNVIDLLQIHFGPDPEKVVENGETLAAMKDAQKEGKVRFLGASIDGELATRLIRSRDFDVMQMEYHLLNQKNKKNIQFAKERGMGVLIRTGIGRGLLTSRALELMDTEFREKEKVSQLLELVENDGDLLQALALQFLYQEEGISSVLIGTKSVERFKKNMELLEREVDPVILQKAIEIGAE
ncbi:aldo/keto reductase [Tepidibacillus marianensis]|uniref:aldo/keto reductase n=1 Tax=Tepidibacillus marianensis TaxID=3131995 RepID=UPI0030D576F7